MLPFSIKKISSDLQGLLPDHGDHYRLMQQLPLIHCSHYRLKCLKIGTVCFLETTPPIIFPPSWIPPRKERAIIFLSGSLQLLSANQKTFIYKPIGVKSYKLHVLTAMSPILLFVGIGPLLEIAQIYLFFLFESFVCLNGARQ